MSLTDLNPTAALVTLTVLALPISVAYLFNNFSRPTAPNLPVCDRALVRFRPSPRVEVSKAIEAPDEWFTDAKIFELERRAIFSQVGICAHLTGQVLNVTDLVVYHALDSC